MTDCDAPARVLEAKEDSAGKQVVIDGLEMLRVALDRVIRFVVRHQGPGPYETLQELVKLDQEVSALCHTTRVVLPPITYLCGYEDCLVGFCKVPVLRHSLGAVIFLDPGWQVAMQGLLKTVEWERRRIEAGANVSGQTESRQRVDECGEGCLSASGESIYRREGDYWKVTFQEKTIHLRNQLGLQYIAALIEQKGRELHAAELLAKVSNHPAFRSMKGAEILDDRSRGEYRKRYEDLQFQLEEADKNNDLGRKEKIQEELDILTRQLTVNTGPRGQKRKMGDDAEKARKSISMAINRVIEALAEKHPRLARHFEDSIKMGQFMSYLPAAKTDWIT